MIQEIKYPQKYIKLQNIEICSNKLIGGGSLIGFDNFSPLLIGKGDIPQIWLYSKIDKSNWIPLVSESNSNHSMVKVKKDIGQREVTISIETTILIKAKMLDDESGLVNILDLRPVGLNLFGDSAGLTLGSSKFSGNTFQGVTFMIGISENDNKPEKAISYD